MDTPTFSDSRNPGGSRFAELSVFFPCYNEEQNIRPLLEQALTVFPRHAAKVEIIIVDDGSKDETRRIAEEFAAVHPEVRVISQPNGGYGSALQTGFMNARFSHVFFADADLQFDLNDFEKLVPHSDADFVIGYRLQRADGFKRVVTMKMLKLWSWVFFGYPLYIRDTNCAFKLIKRESLLRLMPLYSSSMLITTELLLRAHRAGMKIAQVGVRHFDRRFGDPTGQNPGVILRAVKDTFALRRKLQQIEAEGTPTDFHSSIPPVPQDSSRMPPLKMNGL